MEDFKHDEETDDVYTMTAVIKDKAGNETEKEVMFSVNRFGSNYIFSETTEKFLDDVYANKPKDLVVTEVNVDSLVFNGISYGLDGTKKELKDQKILSGSGLFKKGSVLKDGDVNKDYFTQVDIRTTKEIKLYSKDADILTTHPTGSYALEKDDKDQLTLKITNPKEFWSVSKYLVIQVK